VALRPDDRPPPSSGRLAGLALAYVVCLLQKMGGQSPYYWQIMLPGGIFGVIVGYATVQYGGPAAVAVSRN